MAEGSMDDNDFEDFGDFHSSAFNNPPVACTEAEAPAPISNPDSRRGSEDLDVGADSEVTPSAENSESNAAEPEFIASFEDAGFDDRPPAAESIVEPPAAPKPSTNYQTLVKSLFNSEPSPDSETPSFPEFNNTLDQELSEILEKPVSWTHVSDFESSNSLLFKWPNSTSRHKLLKCLNISETTTVMYSTKWGTLVEVPKFAASLLDTPLQPEPLLPSTSTVSPVVAVPVNSNSAPPPSSSSSLSSSDFDDFQSHKVQSPSTSNSVGSYASNHKTS